MLNSEEEYKAAVETLREMDLKENLTTAEQMERAVLRLDVNAYRAQHGIFGFTQDES